MRHIGLRAALLTTAVAFRPFDNKAGWKVDADGKLEADANGNPIYVDASGREMVTEAGTIARLNNEAQTHRTAKETAEGKLKVFTDAGLTADNIKAHVDAVATVAKLDQKSLIDAGEVDRVKAEISATYQAKLDAVTAENATLKSNNDNLTLGRAFDNSRFIQERLAVPREMFVAQFGKNFKVEDGKIVAYGNDGNALYSKKRVGEPPDMEEALELITDSYAHKDTILKADTPGGGGGGQNGGGNRSGGRRMTRAEFDAVPANQQGALAAQMRAGEITLVD